MLQLPTLIPCSQCSYSPRIQLIVGREYLQNEDAEYRLHRCTKLQGADSLLMETKMKLSDRKNMRDYSKPATEKMIGTACFMGKTTAADEIIDNLSPCTIEVWTVCIEGIRLIIH